MRCFLGWCESVQINLGTKHLVADVRYSGGREQEKSAVLEGVSAILQIGASNPLSAILGLERKYSFVTNRRQFTPENCYSKMLHDTARELAAVYDAGTKRCWLVPKLSLLLYMCRSYSQGRGLPDGCIPSIDPYADAVDIIQTLEPCGNTVVHGEQTDALAFRQLLFGLNINLLTTVAAVQPSSGKKLYGFEFCGCRDISWPRQLYEAPRSPIRGQGLGRSRERGGRRCGVFRSRRCHHSSRRQRTAKSRLQRPPLKSRLPGSDNALPDAAGGTQRRESHTSTRLAGTEDL